HVEWTDEEEPEPGRVGEIGVGAVEVWRERSDASVDPVWVERRGAPGGGQGERGLIRGPGAPPRRRTPGGGGGRRRHDPEAFFPGAGRGAATGRRSRPVQVPSAPTGSARRTREAPRRGARE